MKHSVSNAAGEVMASLDSDAEAVRWYHENGRKGDFLVSTGELMSIVSAEIFPGIEVRFTRDGCVSIRGNDG
jgi:hypothetical protein